MADLNDNDKYAMQLAFPGRAVVFRSEYATVTVVQGTDKALAADIRPHSRHLLASRGSGIS
jgi:hypothetical protein